MDYPEIITLSLNILFCTPSAASLTRFDQWWIRGFDFPRVQISILIIINIVLALFVYRFDTPWHYSILGLLCLSLAFQLRQIFPYTRIAAKQVKEFKESGSGDSISILVSNVLMSNRDFGKLINLTSLRNPDILLTLETDKQWEEALAPIEDDYEHCVKVPLDNRYGMHLYSKLPLENIEVKYLVEDDIPSIHGSLLLSNGKKIDIHCLHPKPPSPSESSTSTNRDAELLLVGREVGKKTGPVLVFGDLNDVAWSRTTRLFQRLSGLLDPRRGRGFFNTFNVDYPLFRWPLDHVFHSEHFTLMEISRESNIGSDHFPMYTKLNYTPGAEKEQEGQKASSDEKQWAEEKIDKANTKEKAL